jgi:hypothetical protein
LPEYRGISKIYLKINPEIPIAKMMATKCQTVRLFNGSNRLPAIGIQTMKSEAETRK